MKTIIRYSRFVSNAFGDGGSKRSAQIEELLEKANVDYSNIEFILPKGELFFVRLRRLVEGLRFLSHHFSLKEIRTIRNWIVMAKYFGLRIPLFEKYADKDGCFLNEDTTPGAFGYHYLAKSIGKKIIAIPHNLESLCWEGIDLQSGKHRLEWLFEDIKRLKMCDAVFCISKEESWLLQIYGVKAHYLPYYPPKEAEEYLLNVRKKRQERKPNRTLKFLILGSAENPPTLHGMEEVLSYLNTHEKLPFEVHVAGYKTEEFLQQVIHPQIVYHGTLSKEELEQQLVETDALVINQSATSGALTRIVEHLIAGIPVVASYGAARDYYQNPDIRVFDSWEALKGILEEFQPYVPQMPQRNKACQDLFIDTIIELLSETQRT